MRGARATVGAAIPDSVRPERARRPAATATTVALALFGGLLLAGCQTAGQGFGQAGDIDRSAGSEVNIASLTAVVERNPDDASAYNVRGSAYGRAGRLNDAIEDFNTAIRLNPGFYQAYANRALVLRRLGRDDDAFQDYNRAIQLNPSYDVAYVGRGNMYRQRKQFDLATYLERFS